MQMTIEDISPVEKRVEFEVPWADVAPKLEKAYGELRREVRLKGFRPGKAPRAVLERIYRRQVEHDVAHDLVELSLTQAVHENQLAPVAPPVVEDKLELKSGQPFKFSARVEVRSQVTPKDYTGIPLTRRKPKASDAEVDAMIEAYRRKLTEFLPIEGRTETTASDVLVVELRGKIGEHKLKRESVTVELDDEAGGPLPGLAPRLRGLSLASLHHDVKYTIPADSPHKEVAGKEVALHVDIKEAREKKQPVLDDDLAKDTGEADTLAELREKIREKVLANDAARIERELMQALVKELVKRNDFPVAPALVDRHARLIVNRAKAQLMLLGVDVESGAFDEDKMKQDFLDDAAEEAKGTILLQAIAEREGLSVSDADIQKRIAEMAAARRENPKKLRVELERDHRIHGLKLQILEQKTLDKLIGEAKITDSQIIDEPDRMIVTPDEHRAQMIEAEQNRNR